MRADHTDHILLIGFILVVLTLIITGKCDGVLPGKDVGTGKDACDKCEEWMEERR